MTNIAIEQNVRLSFYKLISDEIPNITTALSKTSGSIVRKVTNQAIDFTIDDGGIIDTIIEIEDLGDGSAYYEQFGESEIYLLLIRTKETYGSVNKYIRSYLKQLFNFKSKTTQFFTQFPRYRFDKSPVYVQGKYEIRLSNRNGFMDFGSKELKQKGYHVWGIELALINLSF